MPPNMTKIFYHWGMEDKIKNIGAISEGYLCHAVSLLVVLVLLFLCLPTIFLSRDSIHTWCTSLDSEMLEEAGGEFIFLSICSGFHNMCM